MGAGYIQELPSFSCSPEGLAHIADVAIDKATDCFSNEEQKLILEDIGPLASGTNVKGLMADLLTVIQFHTKLDDIRLKVFGKKKLPKGVKECMEGLSVDNFYEAWTEWLKIDYKDILGFAISILQALPIGPQSNIAIKIIAEAAIEIQGHSGNEHHDVVGISFCQSMTTARYEGSFYTTLPAATMLATLLFEDLEIDWSNYDDVVGLRIADFACGTGTLLIAAANVIMRMERTGRSEDVARALVEQMVYGFDINPRAIFQTATGLGMLAPDVDFRRMHLYSLILGIDQGGHVRVGALELLEDTANISFIRSSVRGNRIDLENVPIEQGMFNIGILNPPYTRNSLRHHHLLASERTVLQAREKELYAGTGIPHTSNANGFFVLSEKYLDKEKGRMGFVVPTAMATNPSALWTRRFLSEKFYIKYLIVSYDPQRIYHSGNTDIGEILVILERKCKGKQLPTKVVKLTTNPENASDAFSCSMSILSGQVEQHGWGIVTEIGAEVVERGEWNETQFISKDLCGLAQEGLWKTTLRNQVEVTTIGRRIYENTQKCRQGDKGATPALFYHKVSYCNRLEVEPDVYVCPKDDNKRAMMYLQRRHCLKLPTRMRLTTVKNMVCRTTVPSVSAAWQDGVVRNCGKHDVVDVEKAIVIILNSTPGKIGMLSVRNNKIPSYPNYGIENLLDIPLPRIAGLCSEQVRGLSSIYDVLCHRERLSLPQAHEVSCADSD